MARVGIFGGTFDPVHHGHLIQAEWCLESANLDRILFLPAFQSPLKPDRPTTTDDQRLAMLSLAISGNPRFALDDREIRQEKICYTVDTIRSLKSDLPDDELMFLMGADSLANFSKWKSPEEICRLVDILVFGRPGSGQLDLSPLADAIGVEQVERINRLRIESPLLEISSSQIRSRVASGLSIRYLVPPAVEALIQSSDLFQASSVN